MYFDDSIRPIDIPPPPTPDEVARDFPVPLLTLAGQDSIEESAVGVSSQTHDGRVVMQSATLSYILWRNPADRDDPANLAELTEETRAALDADPVRPLPEWMLAARERMRYPWLWDAVRTTHIDDRSAVGWHTPEHALVEHVNYIVMNTFREERVRGSLPGELLGRATERAIEHAVPVSIDGEDVAGMRIDTDAHAFGIAADLGDRLLTAVVAREHLPLVDFVFVTRHHATA